MKIKIEKVSKVNGVCKVEFSTEYGNATAKWEGDLPEEGKEYFVEIEIGDKFALGNNLKICEDRKFSIGMEEDLISLAGCLESIEDDGYAILRLGDSVVSLEVIDAIPPESFVKVVSNVVTLFEVNY